MRNFLLAGALALSAACSGPRNPGEMPPIAPRPDNVEPIPVGAKGTPDPRPVPGAPDPLDKDHKKLTVQEVAMPAYAASEENLAEPMQKPATTPDAGLGGSDAAAPLPPVPDAVPTDASRTTP